MSMIVMFQQTEWMIESCSTHVACSLVIGSRYQNFMAFDDRVGHPRTALACELR